MTSSQPVNLQNYFVLFFPVVVEQKQHFHMKVKDKKSLLLVHVQRFFFFSVCGVTPEVDLHG